MRDRINSKTCRATAAAVALLAVALLAVACGGGGTETSGGAGSAPAALGGLTGTSQLARVAIADAATVLLTGQGPLGYDGVEAVALDGATGAMYGVWSETSAGGAVLLRIDPAAGSDGLAAAPVVVGAIGDVGTPSTLAWHGGEGVLYGVDAPAPVLLAGRLLRIDPGTGMAEEVGTCPKVSTLTYDPVQDTLYGIREGSFLRIDPATGDSVELFTESSLLPDAISLAAEPATGEFVAVVFDPAGAAGPRVIRLDLFGGLEEVGPVGEVLVDLEFDGASAFIGLGSGGSIADVTPGTAEFGVSHRGNLGLDLVDFTFDATAGGYWGIDTEDHLVKFHPDGASRTVGRVSLQTRQIVHDPLDDELWGVGFGGVFTTTDRYVYGIDRDTAALTTTPVPAQVSAGSRFTYDYTFDVMRASSGLNDVSFMVDPATGAATITATALAIDEIVGLTWDPVARRLVALTASPPSGERRLISWDPNVSGQASLEFVTDPLGTVLAPITSAGRYVTLSGRDLLEIRTGAGVSKATLESVRDDLYYGAVLVESQGRVLAAARDRVFSIDPATGATELVGDTPGGDRPSGIGWDPGRQELGFVIGNEIRWTGVSAPGTSTLQTSLGGRDLDDITFSPERGLFYLVGPDGVFTMERSGTAASFVEISAAAPPDPVQDITWRSGAVWAATRDDRLFRVDADSGAWTEVGRTSVELQGLY